MSVPTDEPTAPPVSRLARALAVLGALVATLAVGVAVGPLAALMIVAVGGALLLASTTAAFALGQVVLVALVPPGGALAIFAIAEIGLLGVLCSPAVDHHDPGRLLVASLLAGLAVGATGWLTLRSSQAVWPAAGALVVTTAFLAYGIHRYERVTLGLVETA
ncbi:hypothetical protein C448_00360 [Halococcus morrhuae DSM 1307]|uniref:DUF8163 domain-containing protein n=1 Tax=Halococcus morrhuae DSM 1307 TaxID=931277 RepID=M0N1R4_HALMO|nr:hypothetical protein [Halococcus morrhuae]EMA51902.1 hypothetical protein C448_00360 [Halococcus morrhuae DSM 1307]